MRKEWKMCSYILPMILSWLQNATTISFLSNMAESHGVEVGQVRIKKWTFCNSVFIYDNNWSASWMIGKVWAIITTVSLDQSGYHNWDLTEKEKKIVSDYFIMGKQVKKIAEELEKWDYSCSCRMYGGKRQGGHSLNFFHGEYFWTAKWVCLSCIQVCSKRIDCIISKRTRT